MIRTAAVLLVAFLPGIFLAGCASRAMVPAGGVDWQSRDQQLRELNGWEARGRIAVKAGADGGSGNLQWQQRGEVASIGLSGPFGAGALQIDWTPSGIEVTDKNGTQELIYTGDDAAETFLQDQLGWVFPGGSVRYWMLGIADPEYGSYQSFDEAGWLRQLEQRGWVITYDRFTDINGRWMPRKIVLQGRQARIKLIIDDWLL